MEQLQYKSYERGEEFNPRKEPTLVPAIERNNARHAQAEQQAFQQIQRNNLTRERNVEMLGKDAEALAQFSTTLTEALVERQKGVNEEEFQKGMADVYMNGMDTTAHDAGVDTLREGHLATDQIAANAEAGGVSPWVGDGIRRASGWRAYGQVVAMAQMGATNYPAFVAQARETVSVTVTDENGQSRQVTYATASTPAEFAAIQAQIRSQFMSQFAGINPAVLNEHLFPTMRQHDAREASRWSTERQGIEREERATLALADFGNGLVDINGTYQILVNSGVKPGDARTQLIELAAEMYIDGEITEEQYEGIKNSPFGPGGTWGGTNRRDFEDAEVRVRTRNEQESNLEDRERQRAHDEEAAAVLETLQDGNHTQEQVEQVLEALADKYGPRVKPFKPLLAYWENGTVEGRSQEESIDRLESLWRDGDLTVAEVRSGRYQHLDVKTYEEWLRRAQQSDELGAKSDESVAASKPAIESIKNQIKDNIGRPLADEALSPTVPLAQAAAIEELHAAAERIRVTTGADWGTAYAQAAQELTREIAEGKDDENSRWYVGGKKTGEYAFTRFQTDATTAEDAQRTVDRWQQTAREEGNNVFANTDIFTEEDARILSNPNRRDGSAADLKLRTLIRQIVESGGTITYNEARDMVLGAYGMESQYPYEPDPYEITALDADMMADLMEPYGAGPNRVARQGDNPPAVIRKGVEGGQDVIQASVAYGAPAHLAPLAAAVFANETGWGKYTVGKNNLFNIKSWDGTGTPARVREGDINGPGAVTMEDARFRDYESGVQSVADFWQFLRDNPRYAEVFNAATPMDALRELHAAGYATSPSYVQDVARTWEAMGINPNEPYRPQQLTSSPWGNTSVMSPQAAVYITDNIGPTSTGQHLDVKRVDGGYFDYGDLDEYVEVEDPEFGRVPLSGVPETGDWNSHTSRGSHGRDYGTYAGSKIYLRNGARVVSNKPTEHGDYLVIELPNGVQYSFLHGRAA